MIIRINNYPSGINEDYEFNEVIIDNNMNVVDNKPDKDMDLITRQVNDAIHKSDIFWQSYRSVMTRSIIPLKFYRNYMNEYDNFIDAVKHYYYDDNFCDFYLFLNIINSLKNNKANLKQILSDYLFKNVSYPIDKLIEYIKNTFLGDHYI